MTKRSILAALLLALLGVAPLAAQPEPAYAGVPLSEWIRRLHAGGSEGQTAAYRLGKEFPPESHRRIIPELVRSLEGDPQVRPYAAHGLREIGPAAIPVVVRGLYQSDDPALTRTYSGILAEMGSPAVPALLPGLSDASEDARERAAAALGAFGPEGAPAVPALIALLGRQDSTRDMSRVAAADALGSIGMQPGVLAALTGALADSWTCPAAAESLGELGPGASAAVPPLVDVLRSDDDACRDMASPALSGIGAAAVAPLIAVIGDGNSPEMARIEAAAALGRIGPDQAGEAVPVLVEVIRRDTSHAGDTEWAAGALEHLAAADPRRAIGALPFLARAVGRRLERHGAGSPAEPAAIAAIAAIADALQDREHRERLSGDELKEARAGLDSARAALPLAVAGEEGSAALIVVRRALDNLADEQALRGQRVLGRLTESVWVRRAAGAGAYVLFFTILWSVLLALRPVWLLRLGDALTPYTLKLPAWLGGLPVSLRVLVLLEFFLRRDRVLDAWVLRHVEAARESFAKRRTVRDREVHIAVPAVVDGAAVPTLAPGHLRPVFSGRRSSRGCLLIQGEGGSGKTSLACQIARWALAADAAERLCPHPMLPVLLEQEIEAKPAEGRHPLTDAVRGQLQALVGEGAPISGELLDRLLRRRRLLVIVDHFSEMSEATRALVRPSSPDFSVHALVLTSRTDEESHLGDVPKTVLQPLRIEGNRLSSFMEAYLLQRGKRGLFDDAEYFDACRRLSLMVGERKITILIAKLYAEQMISAREAEGALPESIPELMLFYVNELNRNAAGEKPENREVQRDLKVVAWECLRRSFRPAPAPRGEVVKALRREGEGADEGESRLEYLEQRLRVVETVGAAEDRVRITLDPLAEYLAALHLVDTCGAERGCWAAFLEEAAAMPGDPAMIRGFLLAVHEASVGAGAPVSSLVMDAVRIPDDKAAGPVLAGAGTVTAAPPGAA